VDVLITKRQTPYIGSGWPTLGIASSGQNIGAGEIIVDADNYIDPDFGTSQTPTNEWFFICGIKSNNTYQIYLNGSLENTMTDSYPLSSSEDIPVNGVVVIPAQLMVCQSPALGSLLSETAH
jgi:hypothetical protein